MSRKDIIIMSVLVNAGLITILLVSSLTTKESYFVSSSAKVAGSILENNENGMVPAKTEVKTEVADNTLSPTLDKIADLPVTKTEDPATEIVHKLPELSATENLELLKEIPIVEKTKESKFMEVIVKKGDSLEKIAKNNHVSVSEILKINELPNTFLKVGQTILIPRGEEVAKESPSLNDLPKKNLVAESNYYTVKCGDNPWTIAMKHHLKVAELLKLNNLNSATAKKLRPGDKLKIK
jgi:peptidoglycan DL-endopeptidase LytF